MDDHSTRKPKGGSPTFKSSRLDRGSFVGRRSKGASNRLGPDLSETLVEICELMDGDLNDHVQVSHKIGKICKGLTHCSSVEVAFLENDSLRLVQTNQEISRLPIDDSSLQGYVAMNKSYCVINNPSTSLNYARFPVKLKALSSFSGEPVDALSIACIPIVVRTS